MIVATAALTALALQAPDTTATLQAYRIDDPAAVPELDGRLDEPAWAAAGVANGFIQVEPRHGEPASQPTEARVLYTSDAVYVAMRLFDSAPDSITAQLSRRDDQGTYSDWAHVAIDSYDDNRTAFRFSVNPRGVKADAYHFDDSNEDSGWDAVWEVATSVDSLGWIAEFRIPFSQLRYSTGKGGEQVWGINFARKIARLDEMSLWAPMPANSDRIVSTFGELRGLTAVQSAERLELQPYSVAQVTRAPGDRQNPYYSPTDAGAAFGADLKYRLTSDLTLSATLNPDFGQVEADPAVVNLSAYETFFPERRPFFVEGTDIFRFGIGVGDGDGGNEQLFYSRRIGRRPQHSVSVSDGFVDAPDATTILGAAKVSGKTAGGWSLGVLDAVTAREEARFIRSDDPGELTRTVEPMTNYGVFRALRDLRDGRSAMGAIVTTTHRRMEEHLSFLPTASYAGGMDARHRFTDDVQARAWLLGSWVEGDATAIDRLQRAPARRFHRPDADHLTYDPSRTALGGWAASTEIIKSGGHWSYGGIFSVRSPGFEINDIGFQRDADYALQVAFLQYNQYEPGPIFRSWRLGANQWLASSFGRERVALGGNVNGGFELPNFWGVNAGLNYEAERINTGALRGGPSIIAPAGLNSWYNLYSDSRKPVRLSLNGGFSDESGTDGDSWRLGTSVRVRPSARVDLSLSPSYNEFTNAWQFLGAASLDATPRYTFARLDQRTASLTARLSYTFTPDLSLQLYGQPFVSAGGFSDFRYVANPRAGSFEERLPLFAGSKDELEFDAGSGRYRADLDGDGTADVSFANPDFNVKQFRSNAVLRWEYRPGSTLFVVWSQGRSGVLSDGSFEIDRDFRRLFGFDDEHGLPATNVLLVKLNYWLNF